MRREIADALKAHSEQITREVRSHRAQRHACARRALADDARKPRHSPWALAAGVAACVAAAVLGTLLWKEQQQLDGSAQRAHGQQGRWSTC